MTYHGRIPVFTDTGVQCGFWQVPLYEMTRRPEEVHFSEEFMSHNPALFQNVQGSWYHLDPTTGTITHPALTATD